MCCWLVDMPAAGASSKILWLILRKAWIISGPKIALFVIKESKIEAVLSAGICRAFLHIPYFRPAGSARPQHTPGTTLGAEGQARTVLCLGKGSLCSVGTCCSERPSQGSQAVPNQAVGLEVVRA